MKRLCVRLSTILLLMHVAGCSQSHFADNHSAQAPANHERRLVWQRAHPQEYAKQRAALRAQAALIAKRRAAEAAKESVIARAISEQQSRDAHPCETALSYEKQAAVTEGYQKTFDLSGSGLHYAELCDDDNMKILLKGYLLSFKANSEHHLSSGDSATDMDQATTLLAECQTLPGLYGTHAGAQCESQEEDDIRIKTNWEMDNY